MNDATQSAVDEKIGQIVTKTGLSRGVVVGVLGDCVNHKTARESLGDVAERWGLQFGELLRVKNMGRVVMDDIRGAAITKRALIADRCVDEVMNRLNDPAQVAEIKTRELALIAKQMDDAALNLSNNSTGGAGIQINIGDLRALKEGQERRASRPSLEDRLKAGGIVVEAQVA